MENTNRTLENLNRYFGQNVLFFLDNTIIIFRTMESFMGIVNVARRIIIGAHRIVVEAHRISIRIESKYK